MRKIYAKAPGGDYECRLPWPPQGEFFISEYNDCKAKAAHEWLVEIAQEEGTDPPEPIKPVYIFNGYVPAPSNIPARDIWNIGKGLRRQTIPIRGHGESFEQSEEKAYSELAKVSLCDHVWHRHTMSDEKRTMKLDGDCSCQKCRIYVHNLQMDDKLFRAMNLAHEAHEGQYRKYTNAPYIVHPQEVYSAVAWSRSLPEHQWLLMGKAAWLHDVLEDCPQITKERIIAETDEETYNLVFELTNPSKGVKASRAVRKQMDRDHLRTVSWEAKIIKLHDRIVNLRDMEKCPEKDFLALYAKESRQLLDCIKDADEKLAERLLGWIVAAEKWSRSGANDVD